MAGKIQKNINTTYDVTEAFQAVEEELIASMIRNLDHHRAEETAAGYNWEQWQVKQLGELDKYKKRNLKKYQGLFGEINNKVDTLISLQRAAGRAEQEVSILQAIKAGAKLLKPKWKKSTGENAEMAAEFFKLNDRKINALIRATKSDFERGEIAIFRRAEDQYRKIIFNSQMYAATGASYEKAVDMATKDFLSAGINCIEYKNGSRHSMADYADMALRTAQKRAYLTGEGEIRKEWGISTVIMNKRGNPCPKCKPFVGKVFIDDVWSDGNDDGISETTGLKYPLLSNAIKKGLYHPRCRDSHTTYFEGISTPPDDKFTKDELRKMADDYRHDQQQQYEKRQAEKYGRLAKYSLDNDNRRKYAAREREWSRNFALASGNDVKITKQSNMEFVERIDLIDTHMLELKIQEYEAAIENELVEHAYVILENGNVYHFIGDKNGVDPSKLGNLLKNSIITHNHPIDSSNEYSFSSLDLQLFENYKIKRLRGVDNLFVYEIRRDSTEIDDMAALFDITEFDFQHNIIIKHAKENGYGYHRTNKKTGQC